MGPGAPPSPSAAAAVAGLWAQARQLGQSLWAVATERPQLGAPQDWRLTPQLAVQALKPRQLLVLVLVLPRRGHRPR